MPWKILVSALAGLTVLAASAADAREAPGAQASAGAPPFLCGLQGPIRQFDVAKTLAAIRNDNGETDDLTLVAAHRGYWEGSTPENSWDAIRMAGFTCGFEIVEVDVKPARDLVPVVFHDFVLDRATEGHGLLSALTAEEFTALRMRDRLGHINPVAHPMTTREFLARYGQAMMAGRRDQKLFGPVIALDVKAENPAQVWPLVRTICGQIRAVEQEQIAGSLQGVVFKIEARSLTSPQDVSSLAAECPSLKIIVVLNPWRRGDAPNLNDEILRDYRDLPQVLSYEVNYRYPGDIMGIFLTQRRLRSIGTFSNYYELPEGYGTARAECCGTAYTADRAAYDANRPLDYRGRWDWYLSRDVEGRRAFNLITTDRPDLAVLYLEQLGLRHTDKLL